MELRNSNQIPDEVYGINTNKTSKLGRRIARSGGEIVSTVAELYAAGMTVFGNIPGSGEIVKFATSIPDVAASAHSFGVSPRDIVIGVLIGAGEEPTRRGANRVRRKIFGSQPSNNSNT